MTLSATDTTALYRMPGGIETRWASAENRTAAKGAACQGNDGRKRAPCLVDIKPGAAETLLEINGVPGTVRRIWATLEAPSPERLRGVRLEMFWDGATTPAVNVPIGDFFGHGLGRITRHENALFSSPEGRSFTSYVPMPFRTGAKIRVVNDSADEIKMFFYDVNLTIGDDHGADMLYFHSVWNRENPTRPLRDYELLPRTEGRGRYLGVNVGVKANTEIYRKTWWGEGEVKIYLDGDQDHPTLCGTGTEDYIGTGWGQGEYANLYQGCPLADHEGMEYGFYRLHVPDPVWFHKDIRVTIQQIGHGDAQAIRDFQTTGVQLQHGASAADMGALVAANGGIFERSDDWSSCAWLYLDRPENSFPPLPAVALRR